MLVAAIWLVPYFDLRKRADEVAGGKKIEVEIYPDEVVVGSGEGQWEIPLDGTSNFEEFDDLMVLFTPKNAILAIPCGPWSLPSSRISRECSSRAVFPKNSGLKTEALMISQSKIVVRYQETDQMGIAHHSVYPVWFEVARTDFIKKLGVSYSEIEKMGLCFP